MKREEFIALFHRYRSNQCSAEEAEQLIRYIQHGKDRHLMEKLMGQSEQEVLAGDASRIEIQPLLDRVFLRIQQEKHIHPIQKNIHGRWRWVAAAAVLLVTVAAIFWHTFDDRGGMPQIVDLKTEDIAPGGNRAVLSLSDGRKITLNEAQSGIVVDAARITYEDGSVAALNAENTEMLALTTPKGGMYQITLADGTKVWLNAASNLIYPSEFTDNERRVVLSGEAYFDVVKDEGRPFRVESQGQVVEVLGTQFVISAYPEDGETKTTLVDGAVRLGTDSVSLRLRPGEQSTLYNGGFEVTAVDIAPYVGWKNGEFVFAGIELQDAMKQLSRWYDVEVVYEGHIPPTPFYGSFSRKLALSATLDILKEANVHFSVQRLGSTNRLIVRP